MKTRAKSWKHPTQLVFTRSDLAQLRGLLGLGELQRIGVETVLERIGALKEALAKSADEELRRLGLVTESGTHRH